VGDEGRAVARGESSYGSLGGAIDPVHGPALGDQGLGHRPSQSATGPGDEDLAHLPPRVRATTISSCGENGG
jgi:hypothetical protein